MISIIFHISEVIFQISEVVYFSYVVLIVVMSPAGQCKHHRAPLGPRDVREFESAVQRVTRPQYRVTGILVSHSG